MQYKVYVSLLISAAVFSGASMAQTAAPAALDAKAQAAAEKAAAKEEKARVRAEQARVRALQRQYGLGPYPEETEAYLASKPEPLRPLYRALYTGGERNAVLNFQRLGLAAMQAGEWKDAQWAFDRALDRIETVYANNPKAAAARSAFHNEANKDFKGEPYERAMAYYYRGLLYLRAEDYGNARASFKSAEYMDTLSETESFQSDFAVMNYLIGWTQQCEGQGSSAKESFDIAAKAQAGLSAPPPNANVLFISEIGNGPVKAQEGASSQKLVYKAGADYPENGVMVQMIPGGKRAPAPTDIKLSEASSIYYQATTRGPRGNDANLQGKANLREGTSAVGSSLLTSGLASGDLTSMGVGAVFSLFSKTVKTKADIRSWDGLPDRILIGTTSAPKASWTYKVKYLAGDTPTDLSGLDVATIGKKCSLVWSRSRTAQYGEAIYGEDVGVAASVKRQPAVQQKDKAFRLSLEDGPVKSTTVAETTDAKKPSQPIQVNQPKVR